MSPSRSVWPNAAAARPTASLNPPIAVSISSDLLFTLRCVRTRSAPTGSNSGWSYCLTPLACNFEHEDNMSTESLREQHENFGRAVTKLISEQAARLDTARV